MRVWRASAYDRGRAQVRAVVQPLPPQPAYASSARNAIRSRAWGTAVEGFSYRARPGPGQALAMPGGAAAGTCPVADGSGTDRLFPVLLNLHPRMRLELCWAMGSALLVVWRAQRCSSVQAFVSVSN